MLKFMAWHNGIQFLVSVNTEIGTATLQEWIPNESVKWSTPRRMTPVEMEEGE